MEDEAPDWTRSDIDRLPGPVVLEFGADWCGYCTNLRPHLAASLKDYPKIRHIRIQDGKGKPLGRSFRVRLWPTLIFLLDGHVMRRTVRPTSTEVREGLAAITSLP